MRRQTSVWLVALLLIASGIIGWIAVSNSPTTERLFRDGVAAVNRGDILQAEAILEQLRKRTDAEDFGRVLNGGLLLQAGKLPQAIKELDLSQSSGALRESALVWTGECFVKQRQLGHAELPLRTAVQEFPQNTHALRLLAAVYFDLGAMHPALDHLSRLQQLEPADFRPHHMAGTIYLDFERFDEAVTHLQAALDRSPPQNVRDEIALDLAHALRKLLKFDSSIVAAQTARPSARAHGETALGYLGSGRLANATEHVAFGKRFNPSDPVLLRAEAGVRLEDNQHETALAILRKLAELEPHDQEIQYKIAHVLQTLGRSDEHATALARFQEIVDLRTRLTELNNSANSRPYDAELRLELAEICRRLGRTDLEQEWRQAAAACREWAALRSGLKPKETQPIDN